MLGFASAVEIDQTDDIDLQVEEKESMNGKKRKSSFRERVLPGIYS